MNKKLVVESPLIPASWGELIDKVTILEIKEAHITSPDALKNVRRELSALGEIAAEALSYKPEMPELKNKLTRINQMLWDIEDAIRQQEASKDFGEEFIELARSVYKTNDQRAAVKREINQLMNSTFTEEKSYKPY